MPIFPFVSGGLPRLKALGSKTRTGSVSGTTYYSNFLPLNFYDPIYEGVISSNTSTTITLANIASIGSLLTADRPYIIQTDKGYFFVNTSQTITDNNSTITTDTTTYDFLGSPSISTDALAGQRVFVRQLLRLADTHTSPVSGLSVSGILGGATATADNFYISRSNSLDLFYYKTGLGPGWKNPAGGDASNVPACFIIAILKRNTTEIIYEVTKQLYAV